MIEICVITNLWENIYQWAMIQLGKRFQICIFQYRGLGLDVWIYDIQ